MMAVPGSTGPRPAVLVVPMVVVGFEAVGLRGRDRRRDDGSRWSRGCRRWWRWTRRDGPRGGGRGCRGDGRGRRTRRTRGRWSRFGPGSADGRRRGGRCATTRNHAKYQQASFGPAGGDLRGRRMDHRRRDDRRMHRARATWRWRRPGGGPDRRLGAARRLGALMQSACDAEREDGQQRHRYGDRPGLGVASPSGLPIRLLLMPEGQDTNASNRAGSHRRHDGGERPGVSARRSRRSVSSGRGRDRARLARERGTATVENPGRRIPPATAGATRPMRAGRRPIGALRLTTLRCPPR